MIEKTIVGFVIKKVEYKDNDAIFNILTPIKKEAFKARGILKATSKNASSCNYFSISEFVLTSKSEIGNAILKSSSIIKMYHTPFEDLAVASSFLFLYQIIDQVCENISIYDLCIECFEKLDAKESPLGVCTYFLKEVCNRLGYTPSMNGCVNCQKKTNLLSFDLATGGFICDKCFDSQLYEKCSKEYLKGIYTLYTKDSIEDLNELHLLRIFKAYIAFLKENVGILIGDLSFFYNCMK